MKEKWLFLICVFFTVSLIGHNVHDVVIIGSGPAGLTAGIYAARAGLRPVIIDGDLPGGQLMDTTVVENWPGEAEIQGPELMAKMRMHAKNLGCTFHNTSIVRVALQKQPFVLWNDLEDPLFAKTLIIATGARPRLFPCPGMDQYWGRGISTCPLCDASFFKDRPVVVVGGGDVAAEYVTYLRKFTDKITLVQNLSCCTASRARRSALDVVNTLCDSTVTEIHGDGCRVRHVTVTNCLSGSTIEIPAEGVFIAVGITPRSEIFEGQLATDSNGFIIVHDSVYTSVEGVFVAGNVANNLGKQAINAASDGCGAACAAEKYLDEMEEHYS